MEFQRGTGGLIVALADRIFDKDDAVAEINRSKRRCQQAHVGFAASNHQYFDWLRLEHSRCMSTQISRQFPSGRLFIGTSEILTGWVP